MDKITKDALLFFGANFINEFTFKIDNEKVKLELDVDDLKENTLSFLVPIEYFKKAAPSSDLLVNWNPAALVSVTVEYLGDSVKETNVSLFRIKKLD